ncbi:MAG: hypothetical protein CSA22_09865 [Deltaproteobacteria bacterium]|nr:MAG: hypothetical protein CSA22_09865 [Deltaproteobacteria bacterium]
MKKLLFLIILFFIAGAAGAYVYLRDGFSPTETPIARLLPEDTWMLLTVNALENQAMEMRDSRLGKAVSAIDIDTVLEKMNVPESRRMMANQQLNAFNDNFDRRMFYEVFGDEAALAILPPPDGARTVMDFTPGQILLFARPRHGATLTDVFMKLGAGEDQQPQNMDYEGHTIRSYPINPMMRLYTTVVDKTLMAAALAQAPLEAVHDRADGRNTEKSLEDQAYYTRLTGEQAPNPRNTCFLNLENGIATLMNSLDLLQEMAGESPPDPALEQIKQMVTGFLATRYASYKNGDSLFGDSRLLIDRNQMNPIYAEMFSRAPVKTASLSQTPPNALIHYWTNIMSIRQTLAMQFPTPEDRQMAETAFKDMTGISLNTLLDAFGDETAFTLTGIQTTGPFPVPEFVITFDTDNPGIFERLIDTALNETASMTGGNLQQNTVSHSGIDITSIATPLGTAVSPAWAYMDGRFTIAVNPALIQKMVDARDSGKTLTQTAAFQAVGTDLLKESNYVRFVNGEALMDSLIMLASWGNSMSMMLGPENGAALSTALNDVVIPILDGLKMFNVYADRGWIEDDMFVTHTTIKIAPAAE